MESDPPESCSDSRASDSFMLNVLSDTPEDAATSISAMTNSIAQMEAEMTNVAAIVGGLAGLNTADILTGLAGIKSDIAAIESPDVAAVEGGISEIKSALNAIDLSPLESVISSVAGQLGEISTSSSDAATSARSAKTEAANAVASIEELKKALGAGEAADARESLEDVRNSLIKAQESINRIGDMMTSGLAGTLGDMMKMLKDMADEEGFPGLVKSGDAEGMSADKSVEALNRNIQEMKGKMHHMQTLLDESAYKPVVTEILIGEK